MILNSIKNYKISYDDDQQDCKLGTETKWVKIHRGE
jgi:hypothetical protein